MALSKSSVSAWTLGPAYCRAAACCVTATETMSPFSRMFAQLLGSCLLSGGTYVAVLAKGDSQEKAFGYAYAVIAAAALKAGLVNAGEVGMGKAPFFVWGAIASYIAYKALDE